MTIFYAILLNLAFFLLGYFFVGSLNTSIIISRFFKGDDVRKYHSKNAGATNTLRTFGVNTALIVFVIDFLKTFLAVIILAALMNGPLIQLGLKYYISPQVIGFGTIVGHIFPCWFKFKGGKGIACSTGLLLGTNLILFIIGVSVFFIVVLVKRIVSLASISTAAIVVPFAFIPWMTQGSLGSWLNFVILNNSLTTLSPYWYVTPIIILLSAILVISMHHSNIKRLLNKTEKPLGKKK
ncbi:membrane protein [Mycoplasmopsis columbina SF7]|uniref:Glycerol-3-phosphate acyltransferase n=1 Tax=Mycoplasmopsis columbina SF7 TaxID=1037410 RepID=F9UK32_9BACT|nr:glycerol-3-phosphate 1-O-acyltransferase PlsY [Mycoplasmopsis columbina]EGV00037.1 membrane protein [Mycoplasmopsis columbina SF7]